MAKIAFRPSWLGVLDYCFKDEASVWNVTEESKLSLQINKLLVIHLLSGCNQHGRTDSVSNMPTGTGSRGTSLPLKTSLV